MKEHVHMARWDGKPKSPIVCDVCGYVLTNKLCSGTWKVVWEKPKEPAKREK